MSVRSAGRARRRPGGWRAWSRAGVALLALAAPARAQEDPRMEARVRALEARLDSLGERAAPAAAIEELRARLEAVLRELDRLRVGPADPAPDTAAFGLAPGAAGVYRVDRGVSMGGYGEVLYENFAARRDDGVPAAARDRLDALRAVFYLGYRFNERILFNSEIELEHGSTGAGGSASIEFAYLEYGLGEGIGLRGGLLLVPMGFINEQHEPTTFLGTERPETEQAILPTTWRENGVGVFAELDRFSLRAYLINGFDGAGQGEGAGGFSAAGLRGGRQKGARALAEDFAGVARAEWRGGWGLSAGASVYVGESGQNAPSALSPDRTVGALTLVYEGHAQYRARGWDVRALFAAASLRDVEELNALRGLEGPSSIGERLRGGYVIVGYDVLSRVRTGHSLLPYLRYERLDTQARVPAGFESDPAQRRSSFTLGLAWRPIPGMVVKGDYQFRSNDARSATDQLNVALGYSF